MIRPSFLPLIVCLNVFLAGAFLFQPVPRNWARTGNVGRRLGLPQIQASPDTLLQYLTALTETRIPSWYNHSLVKHICYEELEHVPLQYLDQGIVDGLRARYYAGLTAAERNMPAADKAVNPVVALPGVSKSGKSTQLKYFPESGAYKSYHAERCAEPHPDFRVSLSPPLVVLLTFNGPMTHPLDMLGLRIVFGALAGLNMTTCTWADFATRFGDLHNLSGADAVVMLRRVFGADRLILIGVDELAKCKDADAIAKDLGAILDADRRTDCVVTALTPQFINKLVLGSQRKVIYVPVKVHALTVAEYDAIQDKIVKAWETHAEGPLRPFTRNILRALPILAGGHFGTVVDLVMWAKRGSLERFVQRNHNEGSPAMQLILELCWQDLFQSHMSPPANLVELEFALSVKARAVSDVGESLFRAMVEGARCILFDHKGFNMNEVRNSTAAPKSSVSFRPGITLAMFFRKLPELNKTPDDKLCPLLRAAKALFDGVELLTEYWERACMLSTYAHIVDHRTPSARVSRNVGVILGVPLFADAISVTGTVQLVFGGSPVGQQPNSLVVGAERQRGWDFCLCGTTRDRIAAYVYAQIKIALSTTRSWEDVAANAIVNILDDHVGNRTLTQEQEHEELKRVCVVFMWYAEFPDEHADNFGTSQWRDRVLGVLQRRLQSARLKADAAPSIDERAVKTRSIERLSRAIRYVDLNWTGNVRLLDKEGLEEFCIPTLLPLAQLVEVVGESE